ncbi:hypothetical protein CLE01_24000 [Cryobacterium levicorallinum]|uniref:50S ribosome-binding GTPase n=1 Tax=Cryobacterium levicorallinum TaxID=995038 RepID=A0ABY1EGE7_9MICO|nr:hypothetical protein CLE01_24000 [Cryobacterium levicorallinum]SFH76068.1 50S ribosome-binding GTPase [Cryobacterium levicorallinum]
MFAVRSWLNVGDELQESREDTDFDRAIASALAAGRDEMAQLDELGESAISSYAIPLPPTEGLGPLLQEVASATDDFAKRVRTHLSGQRDVLSTFNVAFFGRTGAGKSTLLSAFGQLDGSDVSPGDSDWTTEVHSVAWRGCRLFDTPGINGWGGRKSRAELEATARSAVEIADVVLLCFDSQSQQPSEFSKVADWVRHYGKPTIAVLNIRNLRWRHPAKVPNQTARQNVSEPVRQHSDNIRTELASIGLPDAPVVAIHSRRALFARASTPYRGPAEKDFLNEREQHGINYLARWSNFGTLEALLTCGIAAGGAQLRLTSLREGMRAILHDEASMLKALDQRLNERFDEIDRAISRHLEVLGYLEPDERAVHLHDDEWSGDLLTIAEIARGGPYLSPAEGTFSRYLRTLLKPHLSKPRGDAQKRFKRLEREAFEERKDIDKDTFVSKVFDEPEIAAALEHVWTESAQFLERELSMAAAELRHHAFSAERESSDLGGTAGSGSRAFEAALRASGLLTGVTAAIGGIALLNAWNPIGWAGGVVVAGISITSSVLGFVGGRHGESAEKQRAEARSKATYAGRTAIRTTFDSIEKDFAVDARSVAWQEAAPSVKSLLREAVVLAHLRQQITSIAKELDEKAAKIATSPSVDILEGAQQSLLSESSANSRDHRDIQRVLLGEDWLDAAITPSNTNTDIGDREAFVESCRAHHDADVNGLRRAFADALVGPDITRVAGWTQLLADAAKRDAAFRPALMAATPPRGARPSVAVAGDSSAGKSSFIKRLLVEMDGDVPETLHIRADPSTDDVHVYQLGSVDVVDTPGFQSGRSRHDDKAVSATTNAALVIVLLHVNLLIGDTARLEGVVKGTEAAPGKWPRMLFLINRCDELGVDPVHGVDEYFNRRDRKAAELHAALASRGIDIDTHHIHGIAADPFSAVGRHLPVTRAEYDANREWDGVDAFLEALRSLSPGDIAQANALAALDNAMVELLHLSTETRAECEANRVAVDKHDALIRSLGECLEDGQHLSDTLEHTLSETVSRHTTEAIRKMRVLARGDDDGLAKAMASWNNTDLHAEIDEFLATAADEIGEWAVTHESAINRELAAMNFDQKLGTPVADDEEAPRDTVADVTGVGGFVISSVQKLVSGLGTRDAAYAIGKKIFRIKFKPWGAIKAGKTVARAGVVLQVAATAWDVVGWIRTEGKRSTWDETITVAVESVEQNSDERVAGFLRGEDAPVTYLEERHTEISGIRNDHQNQQVLVRYELARTERRLVVVAALLDAFDDLRKETV